MSGGRVLPLVVLTAVVLIGTGALAPVPFLSVEVADARTIRLALTADDAFAYRYRHSVYDAPVEERFRVEGDAMRQTEIRSTDRRALEYYGLPFAAHERDGTLVIPGNPRPMPEIALAVLREQEQTLVLGGRRFELSAELGDARVVLRPFRMTRVQAFLATSR